ncbi:hypothetical protein IJ579_04555 [bacterium]|nr:hypothetical protein [bacterium]
MNIHKLAKHLKEFALDEIEMIAECDCKTELEQLLNEGKLVFEQGLYRYIEKDNDVDYAVFTNKKYSRKSMDINNAIKYFMNNYVQKNCKKGTAKNYNTLFKHIILPFFRDKEISKININDIKNFYLYCSNQNLKPRRIKNSLALLNQLLKYFRQLGYIKNDLNFQVKRLTDKNKFSINRINFI